MASKAIAFKRSITRAGAVRLRAGPFLDQDAAAFLLRGVYNFCGGQPPNFTVSLQSTQLWTQF